jgi:hypothetical protein
MKRCLLFLPVFYLCSRFQAQHHVPSGLEFVADTITQREAVEH